MYSMSKAINYYYYHGHEVWLTDITIPLLESCLTFFTPSDANALACKLVSKGVKGN